MIAIVIFLVSMKIYEEIQKSIVEEKRFNLRAYWGHIRIYVLVCFIASFAGSILTLTESVCMDLQTKLINDFGGDSASPAIKSMQDLVREQVHLVHEKELEGTSFDHMNSGTFVFSYIFKALTGIALTIGLFLFKYTYTFFILGRYMWLLMLELVAPIAIVLCIHEATRSYFYTWIKNMIICYLLIPFFLLADAFSNEVASLFMASNARGGEITITIVVLAGVWVKIKMFSVVRVRSSQLF